MVNVGLIRSLSALNPDSRISQLRNVYVAGVWIPRPAYS